MRVSAKADYALRGVLEIAAAKNPPVKRDEIARAQRIPVKFLETILGELKHAGIVASQRGADGGYSLAKSADEGTVADVIRGIDGPLPPIRDTRPRPPAPPPRVARLPGRRGAAQGRVRRPARPYAGGARVGHPGRPCLGRA